MHEAERLGDRIEAAGGPFVSCYTFTRGLERLISLCRGDQRIVAAAVGLVEEYAREIAANVGAGIPLDAWMGDRLRSADNGDTA
jgi:hypothetical protein